MTSPAHRSFARVFAYLVITVFAAPLSTGAASLVYPETRAGDHVDDYHGIKVADPYRWLEDLDSAETAAWVRAQNEITYGYLETIQQRPCVATRIERLYDYARAGIPERHGEWLFSTHNDGLLNHDVLHKQRGLDGERTVLLDPNALSEDGSLSLALHGFSHDGRYLAYGLSRAGTDWREVLVRDVESGEDLPDRLQHVKFSALSWTLDRGGFFYSRYPAPDDPLMSTAAHQNHRLYYHRLGTPQSEDLLIYERPDKPHWSFGATVTDDGRYAVISSSESTAELNRVFLIDLGDPESPRLDAPVRPFLVDHDAEYKLIDNRGSTLFFETNLDAPNRRLIAIDLEHPARDKWRTIIPERDESILHTAMIGDRFVVNTLSDVVSRVRVYDLTGRMEREVKLPGLGRVRGLKGDRTSDETFFSFESHLQPRTVYRLDVATGQSEVFFAPEVDFDASLYEARQVFYKSKDGTRVPMFLVHRRGIERNGEHPTLLYGYGGFNISQTPSFSSFFTTWLEMGGILAVPNLRGGGEYGEGWHAAGTLERKQNVFDDCIAAAEYLIAEGFTTPARLAVSGRSNGGLLVGAVLTQRPDLVGAALPGVGVLDMLRYHKFTIGWAWAADYGTASDPEGFRYLYAYSPLHNLKTGTHYPATLITTADHDDRVVPGHSYKFAAALQAAQAGEAPTLIRIDVTAGHGRGKPTRQSLAEKADELAFLAHIFDMDVSCAEGRPAP